MTGDGVVLLDDDNDALADGATAAGLRAVRVTDYCGMVERW